MLEFEAFCEAVPLVEVTLLAPLVDVTLVGFEGVWEPEPSVDSVETEELFESPPCPLTWSGVTAGLAAA